MRCCPVCPATANATTPSPRPPHTPPAARAPLPPVDVDSITAVGAHVRHAVFGPGTVESVAGRRVTVRFTAGPRTLDAQVVAERHLMWAE